MARPVLIISLIAVAYFVAITFGIPGILDGR